MNALTTSNPWAAAPQNARHVFRELESLEQRLESLLSHSLQIPVTRSRTAANGRGALSEPARAVPPAEAFWTLGFPPSGSTSRWESFPPVDIHETEKEFVIQADLPQLQKSEVRVTARDGVLEISGEKKSQFETTGPEFFQMERVYGAFERRFGLPPDADVAMAKAQLHEGVLTISIPKNSEASTQSVEIDLG